MSKIAIVNYEAGNLTSVLRAVNALGFDAEITQDARTILQAPRVIFPGVGAAGAAMGNLGRLGLDGVLKEVADRGTPLLGICVGTQIIFDFSEEDGGTECLGLLPGRVRRFDADLREDGDRLKVPHMGWNGVRPLRSHPMLQGLSPDQEFYFVHSYYPEPADETHVLARTGYGPDFASIVGRGSLVALQFHTEKSGRPGLNLLKNFCQWDGRHA
ncbi:MAG: imidazole glycerol phosphate synthase subunit HisH [Proteobacteria bacterium]|nr:imidazole glycerol phosphate synthase subunit HisH [Pseudomonadota bacterium]